MRNGPLRAFVFDAYGTLFDVHSIIALAETIAPRQGAILSQIWRTKQLQYTWLQSLMRGSIDARDDFAALTAKALDYAASQLTIPLRDDARQQLLDAYLHLAPFADAAAALADLAPRPRFILSNGTLAMLEPLVRESTLKPHIDGILSVDAAGIYKPAPDTYRLALERLQLHPAEIAFVSANGWDAAGAKWFGYRTFWLNRGGQPEEALGVRADAVGARMADLLKFVLAS